MAFFHHKTIRNYTLALLSTFNSIETQYLSADKSTVISNLVDINFSSREKATIFDAETTKEIQRGNYNVLPRLSLVFNGMERNPNRATNKFGTINKIIDNKQIQYQYNSIPYDFSYTIIGQARGMLEASMIVEQLLSYFNPTYTININEIPLQDEPTEIVIDLNGVSIESEEYEEFSTNIVNFSIELNVRGNIYPAIKDQGLLQSIEIYMNQQTDDEYKRSSLLEFDGETVETTQFGPDFSKLKPIITDVLHNSTDNTLEVIFEDKDNKKEWDEFTYIWSVISGTNIVATGARIVDISNTPETTQVAVTVVDIHGNQSNTFLSNITII